MTRGTVDGLKAIDGCKIRADVHLHENEWQLYGLAAHVLTSAAEFNVEDVRDASLLE